MAKIIFNDGYIETIDNGGTIYGSDAHKFYWDFHRKYGFWSLFEKSQNEFNELMIDYAKERKLKVE